MTSGRYGLALRAVGRLLGGGSVAALGAGPLLERFADSRDEAAFEALVSRHGPMVLGTCRRMLSDPHDVDDAFQATFLVLARKAGSIRDADRLGPWLHGVARRVATRSRALSARRRSRERPGVEDRAVEPEDALEGFEHRAAIDEELARLPEKYRAPLVLCYLEGLTHDEAAEQLRWPVGTVRSRLAGGRERLRARLTRRGLAPTAAVPAILTKASIPQVLLSTTVRVATSAGSTPAHVANLAKGALVAMMWNKLKLVAALGLMAGLTVGGAGVAAQYGGSGSKAADRSAIMQEDDLARLQGTWRLTARQPPVIGDRVVAWTIEGKVLVSKEWGMRVDARSELILGEQGGVKTIDIVQVGEDGPRPTQRCLYRFAGDALEVCGGALDGPRPAGFSHGDPGPYPAIYHFEKQPAEGPMKAEARSSAKPEHERNLLKADLEKVTQKMEQVRSDREKELRGLEAQASAIRNLISSVELKSKELAADVGPTPPVEGAKLTTTPQPSTEPGTIEALAGIGGGTAGAIPPAPQPIVHTLQPNPMRPGPVLFAVISAGRDRVTMIDSATKERATFRMPKGATEIIPILSSVISLDIKGPEVTRYALYDLQDKRWYECDLKEPAWQVGASTGTAMRATGLEPTGLSIQGPTVTRLAAFDRGEKKWTTQDLREPAEGGVFPSVTSTTVTYRVGRFLYKYSAIAKRWSVLELRRDGPNPNDFGQAGGDGKTIITDGDVIHIYDPEVGEWTHIDTKDEK